jgi:ABC-type phosphate transport system permease subunit
MPEQTMQQLILLALVTLALCIISLIILYLIIRAGARAGTRSALQDHFKTTEWYAQTGGWLPGSWKEKSPPRRR